MDSKQLGPPISSKSLRILRQAGWSPERRVVVSDEDACHSGPLPPVVRDFRERFGGLVIDWAKPSGEIERCHFDYRLAESHIDIGNIWQYEDELGGELYVIGEQGEFFQYLMNSNGRVFGTFEDLVIVFGGSGEQAIEAILTRRKTNKVELFPRLGTAADICHCIERAVRDGETWRVRRIARALEMPDVDVKACAIDALAALGADEGIEPLANVAHSGHGEDMAVRAVRAVRQIGSSEAVRALEQMVYNHRPKVIGAVIQALQECGDPASLPALEELLDLDEPCGLSAGSDDGGELTINDAASRAMQSIREGGDR